MASLGKCAYRPRVEYRPLSVVLPALGLVSIMVCTAVPSLTAQTSHRPVRQLLVPRVATPSRGDTMAAGAGKRTVAGGKAADRSSLLAQSGDAYVRQTQIAVGMRWSFGTAQVEKRIELSNGHLALVGFTDRVRRHEYVQGPSDPIAFTWNGNAVTGSATSWVLKRVTTRRLKQGELLLQLELHAVSSPHLAIMKSYLIYPKESIIQEWLAITNQSDQPATLADPVALTMHVWQRETSAIDFTYWRGKPMTEPLAETATRTFDGYATFVYAPIQIYQNRETKHGLFVGWDYVGLWRSTVGVVGGNPGHIDFQVAHYHRELKPGERVETPKVFTGVFHGDWDEMGHQLLDYQYRYKWDYTRAPYFPSVALEGYWRFGGQWGDGMDPVSNYRKVLRSADVMRVIGADNFWRDHGWWDQQGEWNGPNWAETERYLARHGMQQTIYLAVQTAVPESKVAREHPEWIVSQREGLPVEGLFLDQSQPSVRDWELRTLEAKQQQWGDFEWRKDWVVTGFMRDSAGGLDSTRLLAQDQGFRQLVQTFLDRNPGMAFHACTGGGTDLGYELLRLAVAAQLTDAGQDTFGGPYWATYLFPPDKLDNIPDTYLLDLYEKSWRRLLWGRVALTGETDDPVKLDGIRHLIDIQHYLVHKGVFGPWGFVYHPRVTGDSADEYLERLSGDGRHGVIITGHAQPGPVTIYPKGLLPNLTYHVSHQESGKTAQRSGADLMARGIALESVPAGEIIYLNLPLYPGSRADKTSPKPPSAVKQEVMTHMDYSGVALRWQPGRDDNWVSYYQIYRNGVSIAKVAKGTYYFDHALGADLAAHYAVATVDGSGNRSAVVPATAMARGAALVVDDTSSALTYRGSGWRHDTMQLAVAHGTQARTRTPGDSVQLTFTGSQVTWYGRLGRDKGVAAVYVDGTLDALVNTYNADEFPNIALYSRAFPGVERHTLTIVATGVQLDTVVVTQPQIYNLWPLKAEDPELESRQERGWIVVDGLQVDQIPQHVVTAVPRSSRTGIVYRGAGWQHGEATAAPGTTVVSKMPLSGGSRSGRAADEATYTFTGSGITWIGRRCSQCGVADVYVDGTLVTSVDQYVRPVVVNPMLMTGEQRQVPLFTRRWTRRGRHTLRIVVRENANLWTKGHDVYLDALHVIP